MQWVIAGTRWLIKPWQAAKLSLVGIPLSITYGIESVRCLHHIKSPSIPHPLIYPHLLLDHPGSRDEHYVLPDLTLALFYAYKIENSPEIMSPSIKLMGRGTTGNESCG